MLELEFTEGALIRRRARVLEQLIAIRAVGVTCAIDDFGTGYSSFAYLQNIPADVIKIDRSFMGGLERERDQKLVRAMITMAHELNYRVVAEGVETQEAYEFLVQSGCDEIQGYLISRPLSPSGFGKWLAAKGRSGGEERAA
jgi:EAL domain-containing protein (putative c-di-GMP-specific phosphodiesterase class I)